MSNQLISTLDRMRILLVEDNPGDARILREFLAESEGFGFDLREATSMSAAEILLSLEHFDVLVLDLSLPDSSGLETYDRARAAGSNIPIVVLTGLHDPAVSQLLTEKGVQGYLIKGTADASGVIDVLMASVAAPSALV